MKTRSYTELLKFSSIEERYEYLALNGDVGGITFGHERYINQTFYRSAEWKRIRHHIIARDLGCDLGVDGYEIHSRLLIHHMNPMATLDITNGGSHILDPEFLITTTHLTHNAIHYGDERLLPKPPVVRSAGDTKLW